MLVNVMMRNSFMLWYSFLSNLRDYVQYS